jgi:hypothetical protein
MNNPENRLLHTICKRMPITSLQLSRTGWRYMCNQWYVWNKPPKYFFTIHLARKELRKELQQDDLEKVL